MLDQATALSMQPADRMPREIAPGVFWIGDCLVQRHKGNVYHGCNAAWSRPATRRTFRSSNGI
jgi:hypothetical protein